MTSPFILDDKSESAREGLISFSKCSLTSYHSWSKHPYMRIARLGVFSSFCYSSSERCKIYNNEITKLRPSFGIQPEMIGISPSSCSREWVNSLARIIWWVINALWSGGEVATKTSKAFSNPDWSVYIRIPPIDYTQVYAGDPACVLFIKQAFLQPAHIRPT